MSKKRSIVSNHAPQAIGPYSQAIATSSRVYISGQIPLNTESLELAGPDIDVQINQVMENLDAICRRPVARLNQ